MLTSSYWSVNYSLVLIYTVTYSVHVFLFQTFPTPVLGSKCTSSDKDLSPFITHHTLIRLFSVSCPSNPPSIKESDPAKGYHPNQDFDS